MTRAPVLRLIAGAVLLMLPAAPAVAQSCYFLSQQEAEEALSLLQPGTVIQRYCAPCRDRSATRVTLDDAPEIQVVDAWSVRLILGSEIVDLAYTYVYDPKRRRWRNLGLIVRCHEEDDIPLTLPADKVAP